MVDQKNKESESLFSVTVSSGRTTSCCMQHPSREETWRGDATYNGDHFLYWGAATKRHADGSKTRFQVVEQTEFLDVNNN